MHIKVCDTDKLVIVIIVCIVIDALVRQKGADVCTRVAFKLACREVATGFVHVERRCHGFEGCRLRHTVIPSVSSLLALRLTFVQE